MVLESLLFKLEVQLLLLVVDLLRGLLGAYHFRPHEKYLSVLFGEFDLILPVNFFDLVLLVDSHLLLLLLALVSLLQFQVHQLAELLHAPLEPLDLLPPFLPLALETLVGLPRLQ